MQGFRLTHPVWDAQGLAPLAAETSWVQDAPPLHDAAVRRFETCSQARDEAPGRVTGLPRAAPGRGETYRSFSKLETDGVRCSLRLRAVVPCS